MKPRPPWYAKGEPEVLIYEHRKQHRLVWSYTTEEQKRVAILDLFSILDEDWQCYAELEATEDDPQAVLPGFEPPSEHREQRALLLAARAGDADAAYKLMAARRDYEYEQWGTERLRGA